MNDAIDWLRAFNALIGFVCMVLLSVRLWEVWSRTSSAQKLYFAAMMFFLLGTVYGSIELILQNGKFSWRSLCNTVAVTLLFAYLAEPRHGYLSRMGIDALSGHDFRSERRKREEGSQQ